MSNLYSNKKDITDWLEKYYIKNYTLVPDDKYGFVVDVNDHVCLTGKGLEFIPVKFSKVARDFYCYINKLTSLEFSPQLVGGGFYCYDNKLISLEFCPKYVSGEFSCYDNKLISLEFCPDSVGGDFWCHKNQLTSLEFCTDSIGRSFDCSYNKLTSLEFCPDSVGGSFNCSNNKLISLEFCPDSVVGSFNCNKNLKLGKIQKIRDFKEIYAIHKNILVEKFSNKLDTSLSYVEESKKITKVKI